MICPLCDSGHIAGWSKTLGQLEVQSKSSLQPGIWRTNTASWITIANPLSRLAQSYSATVNAQLGRQPSHHRRFSSARTTPEIGREAVTGTPNVLSGVQSIFTAPLVADPGTRFEYGINADWLGRVIEAASGVTLDVAVKQGITGPPGMDATTFLRSSNQAANTTPLHLKGADGNWATSEINLVEEPEYWSGGHGLYSTPRDYIKFQRALLGGGELDGVRILTQPTVDAAFTNQIGELDFPAEIPTADPASAYTFAAGPGYKWGYGLLLNTTDIPGMRRAYSGGWGGLFNSHFWVDPAAGVCGSIYSNFMPFGPPEAMELYANFERAVYSSR